MATSNASEPLKTSADSPDTLPLTGYTIDQLKNYIIRQLGGPTWNIELTNQQILDHIQNALGLYSQYVPMTKVGSIMLIRGQYKYLEGVDVGLGVAKVDFVEPNPVPTEIFYMEISSTQPHSSAQGWMNTTRSFAGVRRGSVLRQSDLTGITMKWLRRFTSTIQLSAIRQAYSAIFRIHAQRALALLEPTG